MLALLHDPDAPHGLRLGETAEPEAGPGQVLVEVRAVSLNFGEVAFVDRRAPGDVPGWDAAGIDVATGARVISFGWGGGWAQRRVADAANVAQVPDDVSFEAAAALPVAGVTALRAVRRLGSVVGRRVLVTGASGGVGGFAVQLLALTGAEVVALSRRVDAVPRAAGAASSPRDAGASLPAPDSSRAGTVDVVGDLADVAPVDFVLDNVGGPLLATAVSRLTPGGLALSIGQASLEPTTLDFEDLRMQGGATLEAFGVGDHFAADLATLLGFGSTRASGGAAPGRTSTRRSTPACPARRSWR